MDGLFFLLSKTAGMAARAETWLVLLLLLATLAALRGRSGRAALWSGLALAAALALTILPLGAPLLAALEDQYPPTPPLDRVDGIIVLGGAEDLAAWEDRGAPGLNDAGERVIAGAALARRFPQARLVLSGGTGSLIRSEDHRGPSAVTLAFWQELGVPETQMTFEDKSRNTSENARLTLALVMPQPGETWVLVTSAWHMPRAMETFRRAGWTGVVPWPVDFRTGTGQGWPGWRLDDHLEILNVALKEYLGLLVYRLVGK